MRLTTSAEWQALSPHLDKALELPDAERVEWLSSLRTTNPALAEQLEALLDQYSALLQEHFLDRLDEELSWESGLAGRTLGAYRLISEIGQGGMGSVWLAERNDARFERKVAVKFLKIALMGRIGEHRFRREGSILGRLSHPHIAGLLDAGISPAGQPYLVLEYIDGDHIDRYCDRHKLNIRGRIRLFLGVLEAVSHAHEQSVVHRDLKPANILVRHDGQVKLLDFGIAKLLEDGEQPGRAPESIRMLTPEYAAPEQIAGGAVTAATDVYALGVLLNLLLTGCHPAGAAARTHADLVRSILDSEPARPSDIAVSGDGDTDAAERHAMRRATTPKRLGRELHGDLDTIVAKALKKRPEERYVSARALAADLQCFLSHEPIRARPDSIVYRTGRFLRRHRWRVAAAALATALTAATIAGWSFAHGTEPLPEIKQQTLTANPPALPVLHAAISPDGKYLGYTDREGIHLQIVETGEVRNLPLLAGIPAASAYWTFGSWFPDSLRFVASVEVHGKPVGVWSVAVGGQTEKLADIEGMMGAASVSPDGSRIAFTSKRSALGAAEIWLMGSRGESPRRILTAEEHAAFGTITWSPSGTRLAYAQLRQQGDVIPILVRTCDLSGGNQTTLLEDRALSAFTWVAPSRLIYSRSTQRGLAHSGDLLDLRVDEKRGTPQSSPRRRTEWSGFSIRSMNATADGRRLAFVRRVHHSSIIAGELAADGDGLMNSRRIVDDDYINIALAWTPDSREVIFSSQHAATRQMYRQPIQPGSSAAPLTSSSAMNYYVARFSPDATSLLLEGEASRSGPMGIYRTVLSGGVPQLLFPIGGLTQFWCSKKPAGVCVLGRFAADRSELVISSFGLNGERPKDLLHIPLEPGTEAEVGSDYSWQLSPDGAWIGMLKRNSNRIRLIPLRGGAEKTIIVADYAELLDLNWAVDSRSWYVSTIGPAGAALIHVDLRGAAKSIWSQAEATWLWGFPSPDARHLAISSEHADANVWMFSNY